MDMCSTRRAAIVGRHAARPSLQHCINAPRIALQIDGAAERVIAVMAAADAAAMPDCRHDAAPACGDDLLGFRRQWTDDAGETHRATMTAASRVAMTMHGMASLDISVSMHRPCPPRV